MPYNTRRKSVSLASLGIHIPRQNPHSHNSSQKNPHSHNSSQKNNTAKNNSGANGLKTKAPASSNSATSTSQQPPQKKVKRVHYPANVVSRTLEPTPPPSPPASHDGNHDNIDDEVVASTVRVLESSGNRPHNIRELTNLVSGSLDIIKTSPNPQAIVSSRLNSYIKRDGFTKEEPCLIAKKLATQHPRRTYFFLTTCKPQPIPEHELSPPGSASLPANSGVVSPEPTDDEAEAEIEEDLKRRRVMSPSPEVDLSSHELETEDDEMDDGSTSSILSRERTSSPIRTNSPPLENDEHEFSASAISLSIKHRTASRELQENNRSPPVVIEEAPHEPEHPNVGFLGYSMGAQTMILSSPVARSMTPQGALSRHASPLAQRVHKNLEISTAIRALEFDAWSKELRSPETVDLRELDDLLGGF